MSEEPLTNGQNSLRDKSGKFIEGHPNISPGRPFGSVSLTEKIKQRLQQLGPDQKRQVVEHLADNMVQDALEGKNGMDKLIWNYLDGLPVKPIELGGNSELPFNININVTKREDDKSV